MLDIDQLDRQQARPDGNAVATVTTVTAEPANSRRDHRDRVRVHADCRDRGTARSVGSGWRALARSPAALPGVSALSSVVVHYPHGDVQCSQFGGPDCQSGGSFLASS